MKGKIPRSCGLKDRGTEGSLTVEAAVVLPLFFMACLTLTLFMNALKIQTQKNLELSSKARSLAVAVGCASAGASSGSEAASDGSSIRGSAGETGAGSSDDAWIDLTRTQIYEPPFSLFHLKKIRILCRARVYPWIGSENGVGGGRRGSGPETDTGESIYITDRQLAYHIYADCTHLSLTVIQTTSAGVKNMRNADGKKYRKCRGFPKNYTGPVCLTPNGTYYYPSRDYGSLTRHVHIAKKSDYPDLKLCERCAARKKAG